MLAAVFVLAAAFTPLQAQSIAGTWQGTLSIPTQQGASVNRNPRLVFTIEKSADGGFRGGITYIDFGSSIPLTSVTFSAQDVTFAQSDAGFSFRGKLSADGQFITGTWMQGDRSLPLTLQLATADTLWKREGSALPSMAADADPSYEVATIKPATADEQHPVFDLRAHRFNATGTSAKELIKVAWNIRGRQVIGGPLWLDDKKFDIVAEPDTPGRPSETQSRVMVRKLLVERFHLQAHTSQQDYPVLALTLDPKAPRPAPSDPKFSDNVSMYGRRDGDDIVVHISGATIPQMLGFIMNTFQARQLVDETGLTGTYNITLRIAIPAPSPNQPPVGDEDIGNALVQAAQQAGFKFIAKKEPLQVVIIDHIDPPTPN
ncbi:MAG: TIGR03435 family protein [Terracidiphilus sp.]